MLSFAYLCYINLMIDICQNEYLRLYSGKHVKVWNRLNNNYTNMELALEKVIYFAFKNI